MHFLSFLRLKSYLFYYLAYYGDVPQELFNVILPDCQQRNQGDNHVIQSPSERNKLIQIYNSYMFCMCVSVIN